MRPSARPSSDRMRVTLLTDFGTADGYVGAMKGVVASIAPDAIVDDIAHDIPPGDVAAAAWSIGAYWHRYPEGTTHVVVVDPGVGSERAALAAEADGRFLVAPDNGVLSWALRDAASVRTVRIVEPRGPGVSATFHGRDVFAPAAARLAAGAGLDAVGPPQDEIVRLAWPEPERGADGVDGVVVHVDRFGNLVTNIHASAIEQGRARVSILGRQDAYGEDGRVFARGGEAGFDIGPVRRTYADVAPDQPVALIGSRGLLEISVRGGAAAVRFGWKGSRVRVAFTPS